MHFCGGANHYEDLVLKGSGRIRKKIAWLVIWKNNAWNINIENILVAYLKITYLPNVQNSPKDNENQQDQVCLSERVDFASKKECNNGDNDKY